MSRREGPYRQTPYEEEPRSLNPRRLTSGRKQRYADQSAGPSTSSRPKPERQRSVTFGLNEKSVEALSKRLMLYHLTAVFDKELDMRNARDHHEREMKMHAWVIAQQNMSEQFQDLEEIVQTADIDGFTQKEKNSKRMLKNVSDTVGEDSEGDEVNLYWLARVYFHHKEYRLYEIIDMDLLFQKNKNGEPIPPSYRDAQKVEREAYECRHPITPEQLDWAERHFTGDMNDESDSIDLRDPEPSQTSAIPSRKGKAREAISAEEEGLYSQNPRSSSYIESYAAARQLESRLQDTPRLHPRGRRKSEDDSTYSAFTEEPEIFDMETETPTDSVVSDSGYSEPFHGKRVWPEFDYPLRSPR